MMDRETYFTQQFSRLSDEQREDFYRTVFLHMEGSFAEGLRREYYQGRLRHMGQDVTIGSGVKFVNPQCISLGDHVRILDHCTLVATSERGITLDDGACLKSGVYLDTETQAGYIQIGKKVYVGTGCCLHGHVGLEIGDHTLLAQNITITPYSHRFDNPAQTIISQGGHQRKVTIGRDCYLGMNVCVLYSADIGEGSVVGAGSLVVKPLAPYSVAVGVPARVIRRRGERDGRADPQRQAP